MNKRMMLYGLFLILAIGACFGQTSMLRDYVGMVSQNFHPDAVEFLKKLKTDVENRGYAAAARSIDTYIRGDSGTGFVYVAPNGDNYIITNYHVISQAVTLSITFEKQDGEKTKYSNLTIAAADEDMDIALLMFAGGQKPFKQSLSFLDRPLEETDPVFTAGFPGQGSAMIWQLGAGMVSNASVRLPLEDDSGKTIGPFIQHTAQVDPGNSGGPLLAQVPGVPSGYAVAGINTRKNLARQAANFSIPMNRVRSFLDASLAPKTQDERALLDARLASFVEGLGTKEVYPHIAAYLSNVCTGENAEFAIYTILDKAPRPVADNIVTAFGYSPINGMSYAVAWTIENALRTKADKINAAVDSVTQNGAGYTVAFKVDKKTISSEWVNEYGIWRIRSFGDFAAGDKELVKKEEEAKEAKRNQAGTSWSFRSGSRQMFPNAQFMAGFGHIIDRGPALELEIIGFTNWLAFGGDAVIRNDFFQIGAIIGAYFPFIAGPVTFTPYGNVGLGLQVKDKLPRKTTSDNSYLTFEDDSSTKDTGIGFQFQVGLQFSSSVIPGLFVFGSYQRNYFGFTEKEDREVKKDPHIIIFGLGYGFYY